MNFGFLFHLFSTEETKHRGMSHSQIPSKCPAIPSDRERESLIKQGRVLESNSVIEVLSQTGKKCSGKVFLLPLTPREIIQNQHHAINITIEGCKKAQEWGAEIIGLGLTVAKIGHRGAEIRSGVDVSVTTGDNYLGYTAYLTCKKVAQILDLDLKKDKISIYGFPSTIGTILAEKFSSMGIQVVLIAKQTAYVEKMIRRISDKYGIACTLSPSLSKESRIVFTAGAGVQIMDINDCPRGTIIIDVSFPRNIPANTRPDEVLIIDGGMISLPQGSIYDNPVGEKETRDVYSCIGEISILSLEERREDYSLGRDVTLDKSEEIGALGEKHGFMVENLYSFGSSLDHDYLMHFKESYF